MRNKKRHYKIDLASPTNMSKLEDHVKQIGDNLSGIGTTERRMKEDPDPLNQTLTATFKAPGQIDMVAVMGRKVTMTPDSHQRGS